MIINQQEYEVKGMRYTIRSAEVEDAGILSALRVQLDGKRKIWIVKQGKLSSMRRVLKNSFVWMLKGVRIFSGSRGIGSDCCILPMCGDRVEAFQASGRVWSVCRPFFLGVRHWQRVIEVVSGMGRQECCGKGNIKGACNEREGHTPV